jgi:hypothetical protein
MTSGPRCIVSFCARDEGAEMTEVIDLDVQIFADDDADDEEIDRLTRQVRAELLELDVDGVTPVPADAPAGSKSGLAEVLGWLTVTFTPEALQAVVTTLGNLAGRSGRSVTITLDGDTVAITGASRQQTQQALDALLARHPVIPAPSASPVKQARVRVRRGR